MSLTRRESDVASGIDLIKEDYPSYSEGDLTRHFMCFKEYDLDGTGFITPENLKAILDTMDDAVVITIEEVQGMIAEVAVLCEHPNDGKLSFRDYMKCMEYERIKDEHNAKVEAAAEEVVSHILDASMREPSVREGEDSGAAIEEPVREEVVPELLKRASMAGEEVDADAARGLCQSMLELEVAKEPELAPEAPPAATAAAEGAAAEEAPQQLMRGTSFKVFDNLAKKRIAAFTTAVATSAPALVGSSPPSTGPAGWRRAPWWPQRPPPTAPPRTAQRKLEEGRAGRSRATRGQARSWSGERHSRSQLRHPWRCPWCRPPSIRAWPRGSTAAPRASSC